MGDFDELDPCLLIGWEGTWCVLLWLIILPILNFIPCGNEQICAKGYIENLPLVYQDYQANPLLIVQSICISFCTLMINVSGVRITKYGSAS